MESIIVIMTGRTRWRYGHICILLFDVRIIYNSDYLINEMSNISASPNQILNELFEFVIHCISFRCFQSSLSAVFPCHCMLVIAVSFYYWLVFMHTFSNRLCVGALVSVSALVGIVGCVYSLCYIQFIGLHISKENKLPKTITAPQCFGFLVFGRDWWRCTPFFLPVNGVPTNGNRLQNRGAYSLWLLVLKYYQEIVRKRLWI